MEQPKQRVFVFDKAELFFLFLFFIVMAITAFVLGMRLGKKQAELFLHPESQVVQTAVELKSKHEENLESKDVPSTNTATHAEGESEVFVDKTKTDDSASGNSTAGHAASDVDEETFKKLQTEYQKLNAKDMGSVPETMEVPTEKEQAMEQVAVPTAEVTPEIASDQSFLTPDPSFIGKYTIQLGSYRTIDEAKNFANGFLVKGYKPLVREVEVRSQGTWYRVSLGVFESISAATQYIQKETALFGAFKKDQYFVQEIK